MSQVLFEGDCLRVTSQDGVVEICLDRKNDALNKLDERLLADIDEAVARIAAAAPRGVLVGSGKEGFLAGADIAVLQKLLSRSLEQQVAFSRDMQRVLARLGDLPVPVVCAVNGYALGGGLEVALCADYRVLVDTAQIGFPEVSLGILPGAGGTVRTPRLADAATALEWITSARSYKAEAALKTGMVDVVVPAAQLRALALDWLQRAMNGQLDWQARRAQCKGPFAADAAIFSTARAEAARKAKHYPAALTVVDLLERSAPLTRDKAFEEEAASFAQLAQTATAKSLVGIFRANQQLKKIVKAQAGAGRKINRAAVLGAGIMGGGIAYTTAVKGMPVLLKDIAQSQLDLGVDEAKKLLAKQVEGGRLAQDKAAAILASIKPTLEFAEFDSVDVVVEAVVENLKIKQDVMSQVETLAKPGTVLASNTSSLSIAEIAAPLKRPEDVVGMHFFNPVHVMPLVEVIRGEKSSADAVAAAVAYGLAMGKTPLVVKDCPGFLINRILGAYFAAFLMLIRDGADFGAIDQAMEDWGWPMGPAYLMDVAGIDTLDKAMAILGKAYPEVMGVDYTTAFQLLAREKRYGQKTGAGFYRYEPDAKGRPKRLNDPDVAALLATIQPQGTRPFSDTEIVDRMMLAMILEAARCLEEEVVGSAVEIDAGMRLGTGFPAHHAGPLWHADALGLAEVLRRCEPYHPLGGLYVPSSGLSARAAQGKPYYDIGA